MVLDLESQRMYELLFNTAAEGLLVANRSGMIQLANPSACEMFGYAEEEMTQMNVDALLPKHLRTKHKAHRLGYVKNPHERPMGQGYDLIGVRKDESSFPLEISLNHFKDHLGQTYVMALITDVTTRKEQEAEIRLLNEHLEKRVNQRTKELSESQLLYRLIARNFPEGTINVFDRNFKYIFAEGQEMYRYGITSEKLVDKNYLDRLPPDVKTVMKSRLMKVLAGQNQKFEINSGDRYYIVNAVGLSNDKGEVDRILLVEQNISDRKLSEERTKEALEKERQLNELKSRFVSMASHEFRTPLSTVLSSLSLLEKYDQAGLDEKKPKHFKRIRSSVRHLTNLLNDFLSLEKVEAGKVYISHDKINIKELFQELVEQNSQMAKNGQEIVFTFEGHEEGVIDQNMLQIMCSNLLSNAIKYSQENKQIDLSATVTDQFIRFSVADRGIGIPLDEQKNMFGRFFRARNAVNIEGTGLGLNIVSKYLQLLNGTIKFESEPEKGTTFYITIPNVNQP
ncbi:MAG: PAS domain S-box protein [Cryomorphaceae bacterium]